MLLHDWVIVYYEEVFPQVLLDMAAQVIHVEEFGPNEGLEAGTCRSETLVLLMGHGWPAPAQEYQVEVT